jgi:hypothetical protein
MSLKSEREKNRIAEIILLKVLETVFDDIYGVYDVADNPEHYHDGDVRLVSKDGNEYFLDAKNDGCIHKTNNVFLETHKRFFSKLSEVREGFIHSNYDYLAVVDRESKCIYILDFKKLKKLHEENYYRRINTTLSDCYAYGVVVPLHECRDKGALICKIDYEVEGNQKDEKKRNYYAIDVEYFNSDTVFRQYYIH